MLPLPSVDITISPYCYYVGTLFTSALFLYMYTEIASNGSDVIVLIKSLSVVIYTDITLRYTYTDTARRNHASHLAVDKSREEAATDVIVTSFGGALARAVPADCRTDHSDQPAVQLWTGHGRMKWRPDLAHIVRRFMLSQWRCCRLYAKHTLRDRSNICTVSHKTVPLLNNSFTVAVYDELLRKLV